MKPILLFILLAGFQSRLFGQERIESQNFDSLPLISIDSGKTGSQASLPPTNNLAANNKTTAAIPTSTSNPTIKPELFNSGFIDFQNSGQMNASARIFKLYIGEPGKFMIPVSVYSGVSGNNTHSGSNLPRGAEPVVLGLINPMSGMFNLSIDNTHPFSKKKKSVTGVSVVYQVGQKMISGQTILLRPFTYFSSFANTGLLLKTGAWEKDKEKNMGVFWLLFRFHVIQTNNTVLKLSGYPPDENFFKGYSIGAGIEINNVLNIKSYYYKYLNVSDAIFETPIYQLTFNYSMKN